MYAITLSGGEPFSTTVWAYVAALSINKARWNSLCDQTSLDINLHTLKIAHWVEVQKGQRTFQSRTIRLVWIDVKETHTLRWLAKHRLPCAQSPRVRRAVCTASRRRIFWSSNPEGTDDAIKSLCWRCRYAHAVDKYSIHWCCAVLD